ncbi:putative prephenate dehydratase [Cyberlindnera fabianii]|uniref:prephenate dehydratase n=1 Tax=Cyberlindnera fabianii TaxID=36022 RepID=A0A1V2L7E7_CYBFA|nr:putative prephenate dehydratase [Cyberlindnera fabianii]
MSRPRVAYLGPEGTYTHQAALQEFGKSATLLPQRSIKDCLSTVESGNADYSVVPFENSTNGQVALTYDLLRDWIVRDPSSTITVAYEQFVAIHHCILSHAKKIEDIKKIYTHPQAWGQVTEWLGQWPELEKIDSSSTSKAAEIASVEGEEVAAIASEYAAIVHNIPILKRNVENIKNNTTRFLVLTSNRDEKALAELKKKLPEKFVTLVAFTVEHDDPGALAGALGTLTEHGISMTSITSRPSTTRPWHYVFFIEFWCPGLNKLDTVIADFEKKCLDIRVLGSFPRSQRYYGED